MNEDNDVYIIFGDCQRSDGSNIWGVYKTFEGAKKEIELLNLEHSYLRYHVEEFLLHE